MITQELLHELFHYDQDTGNFIRKKSTARKAKKGMIAGYTSPTSGYVKISIKQKNYLAHRLAWMYVHGRWPNEMIDHINSVKTDNRFENLRECTAQQNVFNKPKQPNNKSGVKGVSFDKKRNKWAAQLVVNGKHILAARYETLEEAKEAWNEAARLHHGEFFCE